MSKEKGICSECGQSVETIRGHRENWARRLVWDAGSMADAILKFAKSVDEHNRDFAAPEFASAMQERFGVMPEVTK